MPRKSKFRIKSWKLAIVAILLIGAFVQLGLWQMSRAHQKEQYIKLFAKRTLQNPVSAKDLSAINDWRFYRATLKGRFDNEHTILLDNKTFHGKVGYEVYTPFHPKNMPSYVLVNRGFIPMNTNRQILPTIRPINGEVTLTGMLNLPPIYVNLGKMNESPLTSWPLRLEFIQLANIGRLLNSSFFPYTLTMAPTDPNAYATEWQVTPFGPERHRGYALQWFALALTLLILFVALSRSK